MKWFALIVLIPILSFTCAQRDNSSDPLSPLYRSNNPQLSVKIQYDSSKVSSVISDTVIVHPPFSLKISASSSDSGFPVLFRHILDDSVINQSNSFSSMQFELTKSGYHIFEFQLTDNSREVMDKQFRFRVLSSNPPQITSFKCNKDTVQIKSPQKVIFFTEIFDKDSLADSIYYVFSPFQVKSKAIGRTDNHVIKDTVDFEYNLTNECTQKVTIFVIDKNKRKVSSSIDIAFVRYHMVQNAHQIIDSLWANPASAYTSDMIEFKVKLTEGTNHSYHYVWNFGDGYVSTEPWPIHRYMSAGTYNVKVVVEKDSALSASDSLKIVITEHKNIPPQIISITTTPDSGIALFPIKFSADAVDHDGIISKYYWNFGDSTTTSSQTKDVSHIYKNPGTYQITLIVQDNFQACDTLVDTFKVFQLRQF